MYLVNVDSPCIFLLYRFVIFVYTLPPCVLGVRDRLQARHGFDSIGSAFVRYLLYITLGRFSCTFPLDRTFLLYIPLGQDISLVHSHCTLVIDNMVHTGQESFIYQGHEKSRNFDIKSGKRKGILIA